MPDVTRPTRESRPNRRRWMSDCTPMASNLSVLDREMYSEAEAARLLGVAQSTLHYWLDGKPGRGGKVYSPVIRQEARGATASVTWGEFVEAGMLRQYRRDFKVPLLELRVFIDELRQEFGVPYPLAHERPLVSGREIVERAQERAGLPDDFWLVTRGSRQLLLTPASESFVRRARWENDIATGWRPSAEEDSPVLIDPLVRFGRPAVGGISTEVLWEHAEDGENDDEIAETFGLSTSQVAYALAYEKPRRVKAAAS